MSTINTNGIDVNYPIPGQNNSSQGFRNNFTAIKTNLNTAANEISDLQNKAVVKSALENTVINNDMANTLISNASTRSFRATTYNLGNALSGTVLVDVSLGDVQYGTIAGNVTFQFGGWAPIGTQSNVQLQLNVSNSQAVINFPSEVLLDNDSGVSTLENFANIANVSTTSIPYGVTEIDYRLSSLDCGNTITIEPFNRPRQSTQIQQRTPSPTGFQGDVEGTVAIDTNYLYICTGDFDSGGANTLIKTATNSYSSNNEIVLNNTTSIVVNKPIIFTGTTFGGVVANQVYYVKSVVGANLAVTLSATRTGGVAGSTLVLTNGSGTCTGSVYLGSDIWKKVSLTSW